MRSYPSYIGGRDVPAERWVYTVSSSSLLEDVFTSMSLKRALEAYPDGPGADHPYVIGRCAIAGDAEIDASLEAAAAAVAEWSAVDLDVRMRLGPMFRRQLEANRETFLELMIAEGHPRKLARWELSCLLSVFSDESCSWYRQMMRTEFPDPTHRLVVRRQADGVVCVNPPQNAPAPSSALSVLALMAGNGVVVRAPRSIALSTMYVLRDLVAPLLDELGAPPGVLNAVCGTPKRMMDRWLDSPLVDDICWFGSSEAGVKFQLDCVARGKKPILELAGNDALVVWKDADLDSAAEAITECFYGSGQICMVPNHVIAHPDIADELLARLIEKLRSVRPGYPGEEDVLLSPVRRSEKFFTLLREAQEGGAQLVTGGRRLEVDGTPSDTGVFLEPTVLRVDGPLAEARRLDVVMHETFFPLIPVVVPDRETDAVLLRRVIDFVNANVYGLRNSFWSGSAEVVEEFGRRVRNGGLVKVNDSHIGFLPYLPSHGGTGLTGGVFGEANYPIVKTSHLQGISFGIGSSPWHTVFGEPGADPDGRG